MTPKRRGQNGESIWDKLLNTLNSKGLDGDLQNIQKSCFGCMNG